MLNHILSSIRWDRNISERAKRIDLYTRVYEGTLYNHLTYHYFQERDGTDYIPIQLRQPAVKTGFCKLVVDNSVSLLFGSDHFPKFVTEDDGLKDQLDDLVAHYRLNEVMSRAATIGSTGSVVLLVKVIDNVLRVVPKNTKFFTPVFDKRYENKLIKLTQKFPIMGTLLNEQGYNVKEPNKKYWFHREWTPTEEIYYIPYLVDDKDAKIKKDNKNSVVHNHGFVPAIWIRNLTRIVDVDECGIVVDGACTFAQGIDTEIEIDYQLSQAGRALKYSADPLLVLKLEDDMMMMQNTSSIIQGSMAAMPTGQPSGRSLNRSSSKAIVLGEKDEAQLLEISGTACNAVLEYVRTLREYLLETLKGNRSHADKVSAAQSGKAMQAMNQALIWLTDQLRLSYGASGYLELILMIIAITNQKNFGILVDSKMVSNLNLNEKLSLSWPDWYPDTPTDKVQNVTATKNATDGGIISKETATRSLEDMFDIEDIDAEMARIKQDEADMDARNPKLNQVQNI